MSPGAVRGVGPVLLAVAIMAAGNPLPAQQPADSAAVRPAASQGSPTRSTKRMVASRVRDGVMNLDGRLDEAAWKQASFRSDFQQKGKDRGFTPRVRTSVAFVFDDDALYVGARMQRDRDVGGALGQRDDAGNSDRILVSLDTFLDGRTAYTFGVTITGVRIDYISARDNESWADNSYDPVWQARVRVDSAGWTAEMRIPFSQVRFPTGPNQVWGINVRRWHPSTYLNTYWVVIPYYEPGWVSRFGKLYGLSELHGGGTVELTPYALGQATYAHSPLGGVGPDETLTRYGGDMKVGLGSSFELDATVRPDFGQVEADPARVNLSAFETFFPERRPFFSDGSDLFRVRGPNYFYSRRVGSIPTGVLSQGVFERVQSATILGGAKLSARLPTGLSVGGLGALTDRETVQTTSGGRTVPLSAAPRTIFGVGRAEQVIGSSGSSVGIMVTSVTRTFLPGSRLVDLLPGRAVAGGVDWTARLDAGTYEITGYGGGSRVTGAPSALLRLQTSSAHYFQRPDAGYLRADPNATAMNGWDAGMTVGKIGGAHWLWSVGADATSPGFEIRDAGSEKRSDQVNVKGGLTYRTRDGKGVVRDRSFGISASSGWDFGWVRRTGSVGASAAVTWGNLWVTTLDGGMSPRSLSDDLTRGGPLMATPRAGWVELGLASSRAADGSWSIQGTSFFDALGGWSASVSAGYRLQASKELEVSVDAGVTRADQSRQFVAVVDGGNAATFGERYVFSGLARREMFLRARAKVAFAPDMVLTLYGEPFISSGRFHDFGELVAPGSDAVLPYGTEGTSITPLGGGGWAVTDGSQSFTIANEDFWIRSFRSTGVFQWEWRRGSRLYLIWQRNLSSFADRPGPTGLASFVGSVKDPGKNIFVAKVSFLLDVH